MAVYVDDLVERGGCYRGPMAAQAASVGARNGDLWCHLFTDGEEAELHTFAVAIGLRRKWFQPDRDGGHYDLTPGRRAVAVRAGAKPLTHREAVAIWRTQRARLAAARAAQPPVLRF